MRIGIKWDQAVRLVLLSGLLAAGACATGTSTADTDDGRVEIVATTSIIGDVVSNIVGDAAIVNVILPAGTDPHDFEPSPQQVASIIDADLVVANGLGLEEGLTDVIEATAAEGTPVLLLAEGVDPLPAADNEDRSQAATGDPHFWHDPDRMAKAIDLIVEELSALDDSVDWAAQAAGYRAEVSEAGTEADEILSVVPVERRSLVTSHDSLDYFADRFGFEVTATVIPGGDTLAEPSGREIAQLIETLDEAGVSAIFADATSPSTLADTVAAETGREILVVEIFTDSLGEPGSGADTYLGMIRTNAARVAEALTR
jgi:zinc/manganese transport system substrate-binding protein